MALETVPKSDPPRARVFISYSRKDMAFADRLDAALTARGFEPLIDRSDIYVFEDWWKRIEALIRRCDTVVFVISPDAVASHVALREVAYAADLNKRFAPIVCRRIDNNALPQALRALNLLFFDDDTRFEANADRLAEALDMDIEWIRKHTEFGEHARRWGLAGRPGPGGLMLRPPLLDQAEAWVTFRPRGAPEPMEETLAFIAASRKAFELEEAARQAQIDRRLISESRRLADLADQRAAAGDDSAAVALALEALPDRDSARPFVPAAERALFSACQRLREVAVLKVGERDLGDPRQVRRTSAVFSPDGTRVLTTSFDGTVQIWDAASGDEVAAMKAAVPASPDVYDEMRAAFSPGGDRLITCALARNYALKEVSFESTIWDSASGEKIAGIASLKFSTDGFGARGRPFVAFAPEKDQEEAASVSLWGRLWRASAERRGNARALVGSGDGSARIVDAATGSVLATLTGPGGEVNSGAFSLDGSKVVTASRDQTARVWDAASGRELAVLRGHIGSVEVAAFSGDGTRVLTGSKYRADHERDCTARVWDVATGKEIAVLRGHGIIGIYRPFAITTAMFSPDEKRVLTASDDGTARIWDAASGKQLLLIQLPGLTGACFSRDGTRVLASGGDDAGIWDASDGKLITSLKGHQERVTRAAFSPDESRVLTASHDGTARIWTMTSGTPNAVLRGSEAEVRIEDPYYHSKGVSRAAFSPDGTRIVTVAVTGASLLWDAATGERINELASKNQQIAMFSPDRNRVITSSCKRSGRFSVHTDRDYGPVTVTVASAVSGEKLGIFAVDDGEIRDVAFAPDGARVLVRPSAETARIRDERSGKEIGALPAEQRVAGSCADDFRVEFVLGGRGDFGKGEASVAEVFSPDGRQVLTIMSNGMAHIWDATTREEVTVLTAPHGIKRGAVFSPDGKLVVTGSNSNRCQICDAATGRQVAALRAVRLWAARSEKEHVIEGENEEIESTIGIRSAEFSPDGMRILTAFSDATARIWDAASGKELAMLKGHLGEVTTARFSHDGTRVLTASWDGTGHLWDAASGREIGTFVHQGQVHDAAFSPDGTRVVLAPDDGPACIWRAFPTTQELVDHAKRLIGRGLTPRERDRYFLDAAPPPWYIEMEKWPYHTQAWKQWLLDSRAGLDPPISE